MIELCLKQCLIIGQTVTWQCNFYRGIFDIISLLIKKDKFNYCNIHVPIYLYLYQMCDIFCTISLALSRIYGLGRKWGEVIQILNNTAAKWITIFRKSVSLDGNRHLENKSQICVQINGISYILRTLWWNNVQETWIT